LRRVKLDPLYERYGITRRHADEAIITGREVFIVESTARARIGDVDLACGDAGNNSWE
jgi:hypothetical protein